MEEFTPNGKKLSIRQMLNEIKIERRNLMHEQHPCGLMPILSTQPDYHMYAFSQRVSCKLDAQDR